MERGWNFWAYEIGYLATYITLRVTGANPWPALLGGVVVGLACGFGWPALRKAWRAQKQRAKEKRARMEQERHENGRRMAAERVEEMAMVTAVRITSETTSVRRFNGMREKFEEWQRKNPEAETEIRVVLRQFELVERQMRILGDLLNDDESREECAELVDLFEQLFQQVLQNFSDMMNIFILAGVNLADFQREELEVKMLESELDDNLKRIELMERVNRQVMRTLNRDADVFGDAVMKSELSVLEKKTAEEAAASRAAEVMASGGSPFMMEAARAATEGSATK